MVLSGFQSKNITRMKKQVFLITLIIGIIKSNAYAEVTVSEPANVSSEIASQASLLNKEYKLVYYAKADWFNAWLSCLSCGMQLASITSQEEQDIVENLINEHGMTDSNFWIAGNDLAAEGRLRVAKFFDILIGHLVSRVTSVDMSIASSYNM